ncbi:MAG: biotin transporter BioY [Clostridia bacterium]|nr:biotin transporter BioY [Clostridia bacterium]MBQ8235734.1 biotin transporter BioY [Clostridia bacterium]
MAPIFKNLRYLTLSALFTGLLILCSMLSIPLGDARISLQLCAILLLGGILPLPYALCSLVVYLTLGALGLPVFAGFGAGAGVLFGPTGGFLFGFLPAILTQQLLFKLLSPRPGARPLSCIGATLCCYLCGALWYHIYLPQAPLWSVLSLCILPYLLPDALKILLSCLILKKVSFIKKSAD